jgi:hypothetical protein
VFLQSFHEWLDPHPVAGTGLLARNQRLHSSRRLLLESMYITEQVLPLRLPPCVDAARLLAEPNLLVCPWSD